ncbi:MAG: DUF1365 domain-containing protein [Opitutae bacterium]|nr:DUF1365 domain-containing protein [Opitutae bacterium]
MNSCLYECLVLHHRFSPVDNRFLYRIFMFALDLDELEALHRRLRFFSHNRRNAYSFREADFLPTNEPLHNPGSGVAPAPPSAIPHLKARVLAYLAAHGTTLPADTRVLLVTLPRVLGYLFNPVSFYFCSDRDGRPVAALAEVTNTFREMKPFVLGPATRQGAAFTLRTPKYFYVSPFTDMDVAFDFTLRDPGDKLSVQIDDYDADRRTLTSSLTGTRRPLTDRALAWFTFKYPFLTLRIIGLIHWNALRIYLKKVPWFAKAARPGAQRDLYRPHASLTPAAQPVSKT